MKTTHCLFALLGVWLVALTGCTKTEQTGPPQEFYGVKVDLPKLDTVFANPGPEVQAGVAMVKREFRYGRFPQALAELAKLASNPNLTEPQKKLVTDLTEQTRQVMAKTTPAQ